jgi:hypothetical protein
MGTGSAATIYLVLMVLAVVIAILWILLPFAVFGLKALVSQAIAEQRRTNNLLSEVKEALRKREM